MNDVKRLADYTVVTVEQQVEFRNAALEVEKDYQALQAENEKLKVLLARHDDGILRLIGLNDKRERVRVGENMREETPEMMQPVINKLKADAVREFLNEHAPKLDPMDDNDAFDYPAEYAILIDRDRLHCEANKLEAGE